jgi:dUTP pyrophosphatase
MVRIYHTKINKPAKQSEFAAGYDIKADEDTVIKPGEWKLIHTNLYSYGDSETERIDIRPRSGLAYKNGITVLNSPGTIDADYSGEIGVLLINHGQEVFEVKKGNRIAQMIIHSSDIRFFESLDPEAARLENNPKRRGGFGHTGVK